MKRIKELFWRIDYMRHFRRQTGFPWRFCWSAACAAKAEYEESMGYTPAESVYEELSYWDGE